MIGARWVLVGSLLAGCVFTPRPMIPLTEDNTDSPNRGADAGAARDASAASDLGMPPTTDAPAVPTDTAPPIFDASAGADVPGVATPDSGAPFDAGDFGDAAATDAGPAQDADASVTCDAPEDGGDGGRCVDDVSPADAVAETDAESGLAGP
jgi:hypothetical protein